MKRLLNIALFIAFQFCYLEWPPNNAMFIFQGEIEIFSKTESWISNFTHPIILIGFLTQMVLLLGAVIPNFNRKLNTLAVLLLGILVLFFFFIGVMALNYKIALSTLPYLVLMLLYFIKYRKL
ncbi:hypothetical protein [Flavobacterium sp.]|jgi:hypothetical protein|uniref:hypothetical protein n=1 Tax=Flavobacterium sp. TaxID=239 RepID=UPI0037C0071B